MRNCTPLEIALRSAAEEPVKPFQKRAQRPPDLFLGAQNQHAQGRGDGQGQDNGQGGGHAQGEGELPIELTDDAT